MKKLTPQILGTYLGCNFIYTGTKDTTPNILNTRTLEIIDNDCDYNDIKLILRPLSDMKADELKQYDDLQAVCRCVTNKLYDQILTDTALTNYLRSIRIDCDNLIPYGLAVDSTTL